MFTLDLPKISLASARRQIDALKRKLDRILAASRLKSAVNRIVRLWEIALEKKSLSQTPWTAST